MLTVVSDEHRLNIQRFISVSELGKLIFSSETQFSNADGPTYVTFDGIFTLVSFLQSLKASEPTVIPGCDNKNWTISVLFRSAAKYNAVTFK